MLIGYARVSTIEQNLDMQIEALKKVGCDRIFSEKVSGKTQNREALAEAISFLRKEDLLVVWKLDRLGRRLKDLIKLMDELKQQEIGFLSITENIDTRTPTGVFFFHVMGAFAEMELNMIRERSRSGLESARLAGKIGGRPKAVTAEQIEKIHKMRAGGMTHKEIYTTLNIKPATYYRVLNRQ